GNQLATFGSNHPKMVYDDIIVAKLIPGQELDLKMVCVKSIGKDHAKFSPISNVSYRLHPDITLKERILGEEAKKLLSYFS
ncbi:hypothetical protein, partial [Staphylococcus aureus]|uniref:hypothetical protein n=1 Tax=Staphylococcus aureus TaxID=1280 RepID=UPI0038B286A6